VSDVLGMNEHGGTPAPGLPTPPGSAPITAFQPAGGPSDTDRKVIRVIKAVVIIGVLLFVVLPILAVLAVFALFAFGTV